MRSQLGVVPQEPFLFHGTIKDNIIFAAPHATDEEVTQAAAQVGLDVRGMYLLDLIQCIILIGQMYLKKRGLWPPL